MDIWLPTFVLCLLCLMFYLWRTRGFHRLLSTSSERESFSATSKTPHIGRDPALIRSEYDIVIIGSGYGGGVAASRLVRAGKKVCVLERGAEIWPGQFPHTLKAALRQYGIKDMRRGNSGTLGREFGLYQTYKGKGQDVFAGCGLGGTSLINAGVFLRAERRILEGSEYPAEIRNDSESLTQCEELILIVAYAASRQLT